jgi:glycosyltransferase involved in cell wall biosynthesis
VLDRVPDAELVLIGEGPDRNHLETLLAPGVTLAGYRDDAIDWICAADVVVQPSRWEALSIVMLEAMGCGRSLVMTDVDGVREVMDGTGAIVPVEDAAAVADAVVPRLVDPELRTAEGQNARARIEAFHTLERAADEIAAVYAETLEDDAGTTAPVPVHPTAATHRGEEIVGARP